MVTTGSVGIADRRADARGSTGKLDSDRFPPPGARRDHTDARLGMAPSSGVRRHRLPTRRDSGTPDRSETQQPFQMRRGSRSPGDGDSSAPVGCVETGYHPVHALRLASHPKVAPTRPPLRWRTPCCRSPPQGPRSGIARGGWMLTACPSVTANLLADMTPDGARLATT